MKRKAIVTGASRGIGFAISNYLASCDMDLILIAKHRENLLDAKQLILDVHPTSHIYITSMDFENAESVESGINSILESHPAIALLINAAGILKLGACEMPTAQLLQVLTVNLTSTLVITNKVAAKMKSAGKGHIFTISSLAGLENKAKLAVYASSKAALISYSEGLYRELLSYNVNVTCLCPSIVNTDMTNDGRIKNEEKIQVSEIVSAIDFVLSLSQHATIPRLDIHCRIIDLENLVR